MGFRMRCDKRHKRRLLLVWKSLCLRGKMQVIAQLLMLTPLHGRV
jgi:hypothetical protein